jgi:hypothetical protein
MWCFIKTFKEIRYEINMYEYNECSYPATNDIKNSCLVIILFDLNMRESYEEIMTWSNFIQNTCGYENKVVLLGNYQNSQSFLTEESDIEDIKNKSEYLSDYREVGNLSKEEINKMLDTLILDAYNEAEIKAKNDPNSRNSGMGKSLDCFIY